MATTKQWLVLWYADGNITHWEYPGSEMSEVPPVYVSHIAYCPHCIATLMLHDVVFAEAVEKDGTFISAMRVGRPAVITDLDKFLESVIANKAALWEIERHAPPSAGIGYARGRLAYYRSLPPEQLQALFLESIRRGAVRFE